MGLITKEKQIYVFGLISCKNRLAYFYSFVVKIKENKKLFTLDLIIKDTHIGVLCFDKKTFALFGHSCPTTMKKQQICKFKK